MSLRCLRIDRHIHTAAEVRFSGAETAAIVAQLGTAAEFAFE